MLILTRRTSEATIIDADVMVTVLSVNGKQVRLGITAPADVPVHREELYRLIQMQAASADDHGTGARDEAPPPKVTTKHRRA